jgi:hypothetical protein
MLPTHAVVPNKDIVPTQSKFNYQVFTDNFNSGNIKYLVKPKANALNDFMGADFSGGIEVFSTTDYVVIQNKNTKQ